MNKKNYCINYNSYYETVEIIKICKLQKIKPIIFFKYHLVNGFGIEWFVELKKLLLNEFKLIDLQTNADVKNNYGLFIGLTEKKINYLKVQANKEMLKKLSEIAKLNKVSINPKFSVVDFSKTKNKTARIIKL